MIKNEITRPLFSILYAVAAATSMLYFGGCVSMLEERRQPELLDGGKVLFYFYSPSAKTVTLAGDFNGWEHKQDQSRTIYLKKNEKDIWSVTVPISSGRYRYKFVVDYQAWFRDPNNPLTEDDGKGDLGSLLIVR